MRLNDLYVSYLFLLDIGLAVYAERNLKVVFKATGISTNSSEQHSTNGLSPNVFTTFGIETLLIAAHPLNAAPMLSTDCRIPTSLIAVQLKASLPIETMFGGSSTF